jgi:outer membrane protein
MQTPIRTLAVLAVASALSAPALAQLNTFKAGAIRYQPDAKTSGITGLGVPPGADADIGSVDTLVLTYERALTPHIGVEFVLGVPPTVKARGAGSVAFLGEVLSAKNLAPTLLVNYHFGDVGARLRPYVGLGLNYTKFIGKKTPYAWTIHLSDSLGLAAQAGVDYSIDKQWGLFASVGAVKVKSDLVAVGATVLQTTIDFRPVTFAAGVSYKF